MTWELLEGTMRTLVATELGVDAADLRPDVSLTEDLAADSLDMLEIALALESELGVALRAETLRRIRTWSDLCAAVSHAAVA
jgi:acyl carrier protein